MRLTHLSLPILAAVVILAGCEKPKPPQAGTAQDIEAAKQEAQRQVAQARAEASKDIKSAAKVSGSDAAVVSEAKVTGAYDIAMTKADGDHKVATAKCLTLQVDMQKACKDQADADYETTAAAAKATRMARRQ